MSHDDPAERRFKDRGAQHLTAIASGAGLGVLLPAAIGLLETVGFSTLPYVEEMSIGFVAVVPLVLGFLTGLTIRERNLLLRALLPWATIFAFLGGAFVVGFEGTICIAILLPVALPFATFGGLLSVFTLRKPGPRPPMVAVALLLPFVVAFVEERFDLPREVRTVRTEIAIDAPSEVVWPEVVNVRHIAPEERRPMFVHRIGFPYPVEALVDGEGVGARRLARFEGGLLFDERITRWEPGRALSFTIDVDPESVPTTTLDRHVVVGGRYFDTLTGTFEIERRAEGGVVLHLSSEHRLSTRLNPYAGLWTNLIMRSLQEEILLVLRDRAEAAVR